MNKFTILILAILINLVGSSQTNTDVFVFDTQWHDDSLEITDGLNISRRDGYDNQPFFTSDGGLLYYTSIRDDGQADIYRYDCTKKSVACLDRSAETSEYSANQTPDRTGVSVVRVEEDSTQRIWEYDTEKEKWTVLAKKVEKVGYYAWIDESTLAAFILQDNNEHKLELIQDDKSSGTIAENVGRCIQKVPNKNAVSFVVKTEDAWLINHYNINDQTTTTLCQTMTDVEDFAWTPSGKLVAALGSVLYQLDPAVTDNEWIPVADLSDYEITSISRIAVSPFGKHIAIVSSTEE